MAHGKRRRHRAFRGEDGIIDRVNSMLDESRIGEDGDAGKSLDCGDLRARRWMRYRRGERSASARRGVVVER